MSRKVEVLLVDDLDGGTADESVEFGIDGKSYQIDLSSANAEQLREALSPYLSGARKISQTSRKIQGRKKSAGSGRRAAEIRSWAKQAGKSVNDRGRIPAEIVAEYEAAHR
ncbi:histone-like nucleoid-structuring protein Lsr2 [Streptomonospora litoralis]|uniref:Nucleoid-associated protein Lsr2 n=1 Tax=Streptomonospora litoralis TaxID=2498135 RepID=A0A4P6Q0F9_9ACTN|nr:Lsr2 family protein [Streptomonospora litoralis]QBI54018.1 Nucleoid-associated protein Lsr2 [Streptomonospora litoralis]